MHSQNGFSLIETLVAISVLLLAVTATLTITARSISFAGAAKDRVVTFFLTQEAVEFVKNKRDQNILEGSDWLSGLSACIDSTCTVDVPNDNITGCVGDCPLILQNSAGLYNHETGEQTFFRREVTVSEIIDNQEAMINVSTYWKRNAIDRTFTIQSRMFNWQ